MEFNDPDKGKVLVPGVFPKLAKSPGQVKFLGAKLGEYNQEIYSDFIGLSEDDIAGLKGKKII